MSLPFSSPTRPFDCDFWRACVVSSDPCISLYIRQLDKHKVSASKEKSLNHSFWIINRCIYSYHKKEKERIFCCHSTIFCTHYIIKICLFVPWSNFVFYSRSLSHHKKIQNTEIIVSIVGYKKIMNH